MPERPAIESAGRPQGRTGISPVLSLLMSAFSLVATPPLISKRLQGGHNAPLPSVQIEIRTLPELRYDADRQSFSARKHSMSQLLRTV